MSDLVQDSKLRTHFSTSDCGVEIVHTYDEIDPTSQRLVTRSEHWRREREIGSGGFGSVWLQKCTGGHRDIEVRAVKRIEISRYSRIDYNRELEAIAKFSHPKVQLHQFTPFVTRFTDILMQYERWFVKSFGWYKSSEYLFIAMEYLELGDLRAYLDHEKRFPEHEAKEITYQILVGLYNMHDNRFAHRDLKPEVSLFSIIKSLRKPCLTLHF
jgi:serine/threonine protein kinase